VAHHLRGGDEHRVLVLLLRDLPVGRGQSGPRPQHDVLQRRGDGQLRQQHRLPPPVRPEQLVQPLLRQIAQGGGQTEIRQNRRGPRPLVDHRGGPDHNEVGHRPGTGGKAAQGGRVPEQPPRQLLRQPLRELVGLLGKLVGLLG
jgi:hypothetical protein